MRLGINTLAGMLNVSLHVVMVFSPSSTRGLVSFSRIRQGTLRKSHVKIETWGAENASLLPFPLDITYYYYMFTIIYTHSLLYH